MARYIYAVEFRSGVVKIGTTYKPKSRIQCMQRQFGQTVERAHIVPVVGGELSAFCSQEYHALAMAQRIADPLIGNEWFAGLKFGEAKNIIRQAANRADTCPYIKRHARWGLPPNAAKLAALYRLHMAKASKRKAVA